MQRTKYIGIGLALLVASACGGSNGEDASGGASGAGTPEQSQADADEHEGGEDHAHAEEPLGTVRIGEHEVELAQGHGVVEAGKEAHLVVKLPYSDQGATIVRAWIGTENRMRSLVGKGEYAPSHDDYDVHATAPDPLPENTQWWIELEAPDGTKQVGSADPLFE